LIIEGPVDDRTMEGMMDTDETTTEAPDDVITIDSDADSNGEEDASPITPGA
jgi:hypothetical protein